MKKLLFSFGLFLNLFATACAVNVKMPVNRMLSPEAQGELVKGQFDIRWMGSADVTLATNTTSATPNTNPDLSEDGSIGAGVSLGLDERIDFYYYTGDDSASHYGAKWQILGEPRISAKKGNQSLAIAGAYAKLKDSETEDETFGSDRGNAKIRAKGYEALVLYGYRAQDKVLLYTGPYYYYLETEASIYRTSSGTTTNTANVGGEAKQLGLLLGASYNEGHGFFRLEAGWAHTKYTRTSPTSIDAEDLKDTFFGTSLGFAW